MTLQEPTRTPRANENDDGSSSSHSSKPEESLAVTTTAEVAQEGGPVTVAPQDANNENHPEDEEKQEESDDQDDDDQDQNHHHYRRACIIKLLIGFVLLGIVIFVIIDSLTTGHLRNGLENFLQWMQDNTLAGAVVFIFVYFGATVLFIPGTILTLGAGFVFARVAEHRLWAGVVLGAIVVFIGASLGAIVSFLLARFLLRQVVLERLARKYSTFQALERALQQQGLKIFLLLRLSPVIPFNAINYIGGVTSVSLRHYVMALVGILPGTTLYVFLGASAESLASSGESSSSSRTVTIIVVVLGSVLGILALWLTTRYARKELNRVLEEQQQEQEDAAAVSATISLPEGQDDVVDASSSSSTSRRQDAEQEPSSSNTFDV